MLVAKSLSQPVFGSYHDVFAFRSSAAECENVVRGGALLSADPSAVGVSELAANTPNTTNTYKSPFYEILQQPDTTITPDTTGSHMD